MDIDEVDTDNTLTDMVIQKYQVAAAFANGAADAIRKVVESAAAGMKVSDLCKLGDDFILDQTAKVFVKKDIEKGLAFPTCVSVNETIQHYSPLPEDTVVLKPHDLVKVLNSELGVHIDGYVASVAHTFVLSPTPTTPITGRAADAICAAYVAAEAVLRTIKYGAESTEVMKVVNEVAKAFRVHPVKGTSTYQVKRFLPESEVEIPNGVELSPDMDSFVFLENEVYAINIVMATTPDPPKQSAARPTVLQRDVEQSYQLKLKASRQALNSATKLFGPFPFPLRKLAELGSGNRLGIKELVDHGVLVERPVMALRHGEVAAQFKMTMMLLPSGPMRLTAQFNPPYVHSVYGVENLPVAQVLKTNVRVAKAKNPSRLIHDKRIQIAELPPTVSMVKRAGSALSSRARSCCRAQRIHRWPLQDSLRQGSNYVTDKWVHNGG
ncbi:putative metalloprotease arx1 [Phlyctochytrium bullatum]|nr:putative metalloprotease arx1 [Phlyctochytrium bullatum]